MINSIHNLLVASMCLTLFSISNSALSNSSLLAQEKKEATAKDARTNNNSLRLMTFNIRYDNPRDGKNRWSKRKKMVADIVLDHHVDLVGMQEVLKQQLADLEKCLPIVSWYKIDRV